MTTTTRPRAARLLAHAAMALLLLTTVVVTPALAAGGDHGVCDDGSWMKADWSGNSWAWEAGPAWDGDAPPPPALDASLDEDGEPASVAWTSTVTVGSAHVKAGQGAASFPGGTAGTVTGVGKHAISHIVFCYPPTPPPPPPPVEVGSLTVTKTVTGEAPTDTLFTFTTQGLDLTDTFTLAADGTRTFTDLPAGTEITITETDAAGADHTTVDGAPGTSTTVEIVADSTVTVAFVNTYTTPPPPPPPVETDPAISLVKEALIEPGVDGLKGITFDPAGIAPTITYRYTITNGGDTSLADLTLDDDVIGPIDLPATTLGVDETLVALVDYTVTSADAADGTVRNTAVVVAEAPDGREVSDTAVETVVVTTVLPRTEEPKPAPTPKPAPERPTDPAPSVTPETEVRGVTQRVPPRPETAVHGAVLAHTGQPVAGLLALAALALLLGGALTRAAGPIAGRR